MSADGGKKEPMSFRDVMSKAAASAARGGTAGAVAMGANVACLMWMRTTVRELCVSCRCHRRCRRRWHGQ